MNLSGNKIKDLEELKPLESFKELEVLDLFNNEATSIDSYRQKIFAMIPSLIYLDGFDVNDQEAVSDGEDDEEINGNDSDDDGDEGTCHSASFEFDLHSSIFCSNERKTKRFFLSYNGFQSRSQLWCLSHTAFFHLF